MMAVQAARVAATPRAGMRASGPRDVAATEAPQEALAGAPLILLLSAAHPPADTRVVRKEGAALVAAGFRVAHLCPADDAPHSIDGVRIVTHRHRRVRGLLALARDAAALTPATIHASEPDAWLAALIAARRCGARVVLDVHEHYPSRLDARLPGWLRPVARAAISRACRWMGRAADAVVVAKDGLDAPFARAARLVAVRNYAAAPAAPPRTHRDGPLTLAHLGALGRARGWPQMLDALALSPPATRLLLVGRFTDGSEDAFRARAATLGLADRIECTGWLPQHEALDRLREADIALVLFQRGEENHRLALPHKLFDAMAAGLPVIAPGFAEEVAAAVRDAGCGLLVETGDAAAIAQAVAALADPACRTALGAAGWRAARTRFAWDAEAARLVALHRDLAAHANG